MRNSVVIRGLFLMLLVASLFIFGVNPGSAAYITAGDSQWLQNASSIYYNSGNVGIGTTEPSYLLEVDGNAAVSTLYVTTQLSGDSYVYFYDEGTTSYKHLFYDKYDSGSLPTGAHFTFNDDLKVEGEFHITGQSELMGNVGIGTTAPVAKLDVVGGNLRVYNGGSGIYLKPGVSSSAPNLIGNGGNSGEETAVYGGGDVSVNIDSNNNGTNSFYVRQNAQSAGNILFKVGEDGLSYFNGTNVGIGTTNPTTKLYINGGTGDAVNVGGGRIRGLNTTPVNADEAVPLTYLESNYAPIGTGAGSAFVQGGNSFGTTAILGTNDNYPLHIETNGATKMTVTTGGNVGIGTTAPGVKLEVKGEDILTEIGTDSSTVLRLWRDVTEGGSKNSVVDLKISRWRGDTNDYPATRLDFVLNGTTNDDSPDINVMSLLAGYGGGSSEGRVGIGTTAPRSKFEVVSGTANVNADAAGVAGNFTGPTQVGQGSLLSLESNDAEATDKGGILGFGGRYSGSSYANWASIKGLKTNSTSGNYSGYLSFFTRLNGAGSVERMRITDTGNIGIGTTAPSSKLSTYSSVGYTDVPDMLKIETYRSDFTSIGGSSLLFKNQDGNDPVNEARIKVVTENDGSLGINNEGSSSFIFNMTHSGVAYDRVIFRGDGNVGIGTTTPSTKLFVDAGTGDVVNVGGGRIRGLNTTPTNADEAVPLDYLQSNYAPIGTGAGSAFVQGGNSFGTTANLGTNDNYPLHIETNNATKMTVTTGGYVGIGTTNPGGRLSFGSSINDNIINLYESSNDKYGFGVRSSQLMIYSGVQGAASGGITLGKFDGTTFTESMRVTNAGNVGIGLTNPTARLHVSGNATIDDKLIYTNKGDNMLLDSEFSNMGYWGGESEYVVQTDTLPNGYVVNVYKQTTTGSNMLSSTAVPYDNTKMYKISLWMKTTTGGAGRKYFGLHTYDAAGAATGVYNSGGALNTNPYSFAGDIPGTGWHYISYYLLPSNASTTFSCPADNYGSCFRSNPTATKILLRFGNYSYTSGTVDLYAALPTIEEVDAEHSFSPQLRDTRLLIQAGGGETYMGGDVDIIGNVGVGITNPNAKLAVTGGNIFINDAAITSATPKAAITKEYLDSAISTAVGEPVGAGSSGQTLRNTGSAWVANSTLFNNGTNVGIGTTAPGSYRLYVKDNSYTSGIAYAGASMRAPIFYDSNDTSYYANPASISYFNDMRANIFYDKGNTGYYMDPAGTSIFNSLRASVFYDRSNTAYYVDPAGTSHLNVASFVGNVGVGITNPNAKLAVTGGNIFINDAAITSATPKAAITKEYLDSTISTVVGEPVGAGSSGQTLRNTGAAWVANSILFNNGTNVGIGTTNPGSKLEVNGTAYFNNTVTLRTNYNKTLKNYFKNDDTESFINIDDNMTIAEIAEALGRGSNTSGMTKVDDSTAPAPGAFEVSGYQGWDSSIDWKVDQDSEYIFETWIKVVSSTATTQRFYAGWTMYNSSKVSFGNVARYWGSIGTEYDSNSHNDGEWHHVVARISGVGSSYGNFIDGTEYARLVLLLNYNSGDTVTRYAGMKLYKSKKIFTSIYAANGGYSAVDTDGKLVMDYDGNVYPNNLVVSGAGPHYFSNGNVFINSAVITSATPKAAITKEYLDSALTTQDTNWNLNGSNLYASSTSWNVGIGTTTNQFLHKLNVDGSIFATGLDIDGGDITMSGGDITGINKLAVLTIDPLYNIKGVNYSTFASAIVGGVKEEYLGRGELRDLTTRGEYELVLNFDQIKEGSDLWVWRQVVDFSPENIEANITPYGNYAQVYYLIKDNSIIFRSDREIDVSYRLVGKRCDWRQWPTKAIDQKEKPGMVIY